MKQYEITAQPELRTVTVGAKITYSLHQKFATIPNNDWYTWGYYNDNDDVTENGHGHYWKQVDVGDEADWKDHEWTKVGHFTVVCRVWYASEGKEEFLFYHQWVEDTDVALARDLLKSRKEGLADPFKVLTHLYSYLKVLKQVAAKFPPTTAEQKADYEKTVKSYEDFRDKLAERLDKSWASKRYPINAVHIEAASQTHSKLNVFVACLSVTDGVQTWTLVDWTNPTRRDKTTELEATGATAEEAIRNLMSKWDSNGNRYYDGKISWEVAADVCGKPLSGDFTTNGRTTWDTVAAFFEWIAMGSAVVAAVATAIVPGTQVVSAAIWTSIFSSTAAAAINIGQRHEEGFGSARADAFDVLTIVGNCVAGAGIWARGATVVANNAEGKAIRYILIGQVATDSVQGVLIAEDHFEKYNEIMNDKTLSPQERTDRLMELFRSLAIAGTMTYISIKGTKADLENLNKGPKHLAGEEFKSPAQKLEDLKDPKKVLDTTKPPVTEGHTDEGKQKTTVHDEQKRAHNEPEEHAGGIARRGRPKTTFPEPPPAKQRGMRESDDLKFSEKAKEKGVTIFVRDGNAEGVDFVGQDGYKGKPETMKAKTAKAADPSKPPPPPWSQPPPPPPFGIVAFHPEHQRTLEMIAGEPPPTTVEALLSNPAERRARYDKFLHEKIEKTPVEFDAEGHPTKYEQIYQLGTAEEGYVVKDLKGYKFHGDYDLHGVYGPNGKLMDSTPFRAELNKEFEAELILHGAHDEWKIRNTDKAGVNKGPQPPCTVYTPDGKSYHLADRKAFKQFFLENGLDWETAYGEFERKYGTINID